MILNILRDPHANSYDPDYTGKGPLKVGDIIAYRDGSSSRRWEVMDTKIDLHDRQCIQIRRIDQNRTDTTWYLGAAWMRTDD